MSIQSIIQRWIDGLQKEIDSFNDHAEKREQKEWDVLGLPVMSAWVIKNLTVKKEILTELLQSQDPVSAAQRCVKKFQEEIDKLEQEVKLYGSNWSRDYAGAIKSRIQQFEDMQEFIEGLLREAES